MFSHSGPYGTSCIVRWREHHSLNCCINYSQILLSDKEWHVRIVGCAAEMKSAIYDCLVVLVDVLFSYLFLIHCETFKARNNKDITIFMPAVCCQLAG